MRDEAGAIGDCLRALAGQEGLAEREGLAEQEGLAGQEGFAPLAGAGPPLGVLLLANNCRDGTAAVARAMAPSLAVPLRVVEAALEPARAHAGWARRLAMDAAAAWLEEGGPAPGAAILTTDADSRADPRWAAAMLGALARGADAAAGEVDYDAADVAAYPAALRARGALEGAYEALLARLDHALDPLPHDPWPRHQGASGASLGVTLAAYRLIGGLPTPPLGEDRALVAALEARDLRVRRLPGALVTTSGRLAGRAPGGAADTLAARAAAPGLPCDERLEPARLALRRRAWRGRLRALHAAGGLSEVGPWAARLGIVDSAAREAVGPAGAPFGTAPFGTAHFGTAPFGTAWARVEALSPRLAPRRLAPRELPREIARLRRALAHLGANAS